MKKIIFILIPIILGTLILIKFAVNWENPINLDGTDDASSCIYNDKKQKHVQLTSMNNLFDIDYVKNAQSNCVGTYFPAIHITTNSPHNRWVYCFSDNHNKKTFVLPNTKIAKKLFMEGSKGQNDRYKDDIIIKELEREFNTPELNWGTASRFYSLDQDFFANSATSYGLFDKRISPWIGHAYALQVNDINKTIECIGGISWGFKLPWWSLRPIMILPSALTEQDWETDWLTIEKALRYKYTCLK